MEGQSIFGVVHGFVTYPDGSLLVLIWFNETDRYQQLKRDQIQPDNAALPAAPPPGSHNTGQTCLSGCTLLANPSGGILMREVRPGTLLINEKGKQVKVTNVYFSMKGSLMVQISQHCHASITHLMLDTKQAERKKQNRKTPGKTIVAAAEWYTRRRDDTYCTSLINAPLYQPFGPRVSQYLHSSSPQNLRTSGDMWGFITENNQLVRSFDDPHCLICPIGHIGWAQDLAVAGLWQIAELHTLAKDTCMANLLTDKGQGRAGFLRTGVHCGGEKGQQGIPSNLMLNHENSTFSMDLMSTRNRLMPSMEDLGPQKVGLPLTLVLQQSTHREKLSVAAVTFTLDTGDPLQHTT